MVNPLFWLGGDGIDVGIEENGGERRIGAWQSEEEKGFVIWGRKREGLDFDIRD